MLDAPRLAWPDRRARLVAIVAAFVFVARRGALGAGVADRLDPYGADDPTTESVHRRQTGSRTPATATTERDRPRSRASTRPQSPGRERIGGELDRARSTPDPDVAARRRLRDDRLAGLRLQRRRRRPTSPSRCSPTDDEATRTPASGSPTRSRRARRHRRRRRRSPRAGQRAGRAATCAGPSCSPSRSCSCSRCSSSAAWSPPLLPLLVGGLAIVGTLPDAAGRQRARPRSRSSPSTWSPGSGSGWRSTTACSSSPATARRSPAPGPALEAMRRTMATAGPDGPLLAR